MEYETYLFGVNVFAAGKLETSIGPDTSIDRHYLKVCMNERLLKRHSYKMHWRSAETSHNFTPIHYAFLGFRLKLSDGRECRMTVLKSGLNSIDRAWLMQMRDWTHEKLSPTNESKTLGMTFCFSTVAQSLEQYCMLLVPI